MIPYPMITPDGNWDFQTFTPNEGVAGSILPQIWSKPPGCSWVIILSLGAGGGGGGGRSGASGTARGGGGAGGPGALFTFLYSAPFVPAHLYLRVGKGGTGGAANTAGLAGSSNYLYINSQQQTSNGSFGPAATPGNGGGGGTTSAGGASGTGGGSTGSAATGGFYNGIGAGNGSAGGAHTGAVGGSQFPGNIFTSGGGGGGGTTTGNFNGGAIDFIPNTFYRGAQLANSTTGLPDGLNGLNLGLVPDPYDIFSGNTNAGFGSGGCGGHAIDTGQGGNGGHASWGGGGGGGGAGVTAGSGGNGGDGLIIIGTM